MKRRARLLATSLALFLVSLAPATSHAVDPIDCDGPVIEPQTFSLEWNKRDMENQWCATQRNQDQMANPQMIVKAATVGPGMYQQTMANQASEPHRLRVTSELVPGTTAPDPFRTANDWVAAGRGRVTSISFIASGSGAKLVGELWRPPASVAAPYPGIIIVTGGTYQFRQLYYWAAQGLAEAGYMVLTYDSQGQGGSETGNHTDNGDSFCTARGCPGGPTPADHHFGTYGQYVAANVRDAIKFFTSTPTSPYATSVPNTQGTNLHNPLHAEVNRQVLDPSGRTPLGIAGHSLGAASAMIQGQLNPKVSAIVSWDGSLFLPSTPSTNDALGSAHAPTLTLKADYNDGPTYNQAPPNPERFTAGYEQLRNLCRQGKQCLDVMQVALRAATHWEWTGFPYGRPQSRLGERVSFYYTRAWFDVYVKGALDPSLRTQAMTRLRATSFDTSADTSSIGTGTAGNTPYLVDGKSTRDRLSFYYNSKFFLNDGTTTYECTNLRNRLPSTQQCSS